MIIFNFTFVAYECIIIMYYASTYITIKGEVYWSNVYLDAYVFNLSYLEITEVILISLALTNRTSDCVAVPYDL